MNTVLFLSEDSMFKQNSIDVFIRNGFLVSESYDYKGAQILLDKSRFDVVVVDERLFDIDGYEACKSIRQHSDVLIVLLGTESDKEVLAKEGPPGFSLYVMKPISPEELLERVKGLLQQYISTDKNIQVQTERTGAEKQVKGVTPVPVSGGGSPVIKTGVQTEGITGEEKIQCPHCGAENSARQKFCGKCGTELRKEKVEEEVKEAPVVIEEKTSSVSEVEERQISESSQAEEEGFVIWQDLHIVRLIDALLAGKITEITPVMNLTYEHGFTYPDVDNLLETSWQEIIDILEKLAHNNILVKKPFDKLITDPNGSVQLVPVELCPNCNSGEVVKGQLVEHFHCGHVAMEEDFMSDHRFVCPKCHRDLRLIGTDYRNVGIHYKCLDCNHIFAIPLIKWKNITTRELWDTGQVTTVQIYSYSFSPDKKDWLEFQLKPKAQLVDFLKMQGYEVQEMAQMAGSSGAVHTVDILATRDDILTRINLGIGILVAAAGEVEVRLEDLFRFDTRAYDVGINYKVVIAIPKLGHEAMNFAQRQKIESFEAGTLGELVTNIIGKVKKDDETSGKIKKTAKQGTAKDSDYKAILIHFLESRHYQINENAKITGKSGAGYTFDIVAKRDDGIIVPTIAIGFETTGDDLMVGIEGISQFDAMCYDAGIRNKVFVGIPHISPQAKQFAKQQKIEVIEKEDLPKFKS